MSNLLKIVKKLGASITKEEVPYVGLHRILAQKDSYTIWLSKNRCYSLIIVYDIDGDKVVDRYHFDNEEVDSAVEYVASKIQEHADAVSRAAAHEQRKKTIEEQFAQLGKVVKMEFIFITPAEK